MTGLLSLPANPAAELVLSIRRDPVRFVTDFHGQEVIGKQQDILQALATPGVREVHVKACHAIGKTHICSRAVSWFLAAYPHDSIVLTTAPSWPQVEDQIWREIRDGVAKAKVNLGGRLMKTTWEFGPKHYATGIATSPETAVNIQGYHAAHVLVIVDEADGVAQAIWDAVDGLATSAHVVVLAIGNPINPQSAWRKRYERAQTDPHAVCIVSSLLAAREKASQLPSSRVRTVRAAPKRATSTPYDRTPLRTIRPLARSSHESGIKTSVP